MIYSDTHKNLMQTVSGKRVRVDGRLLYNCRATDFPTEFPTDRVIHLTRYSWGKKKCDRKSLCGIPQVKGFILPWQHHYTVTCEKCFAKKTAKDFIYQY